MRWLHWLKKDEWDFIKQFRSTLSKHPTFSKWSIFSSTKALEKTFSTNWKVLNTVLERSNNQLPWTILMEELQELYEARKNSNRAVEEINDCISVLLRMKDIYLNKEWR